MINFKDFESGLLEIVKKHYKGINIYYIGYITVKKINDYESIYGVNPLYFQVNHENGYTKEKNGNKYLIFDDFVSENKELLKNMRMFGMKSKTKLMTLKKMIMKKIICKLNLILMMTCH